ncbi:MAG TPA: SRPBCC domain-containing protein [Caulobacteraceae bacterium]
MADQATTRKAPILGVGYEVTLTRTFNAPAALVFDCFTDPEHLAKWWGPLGCQNVINRLDPRPGGEISLRMAGPGYDHVMGGEFVEIDRPTRLVFLSKAFEAPGGGWGIVNRNTLTFAERDGATTLTLHTLVEKAAGELVLGALSGMKTGWGQSLERLGDLVGGGGKMDLEIGDKIIVLTRAFDASPQQVWRALTDPLAFARWWTGGGCVVEAMDVRPGGQWSLCQTSPDGAVHRFFGEYRQVDPPGRLAMTQGFDAYPPIEVDHVLTEEWGRTVLTRTMTFPDNSYRDGMLQSGLNRGAAESYDALAAVLAEG